LNASFVEFGLLKAQREQPVQLLPLLHRQTSNPASLAQHGDLIVFLIHL
jgi:hypothetical protein